MHSEGIPELLAGIDADVYVAPLPIDAIARVLRRSAALDTSEDEVSATETRARRVWVSGVRPRCEQLPPSPPVSEALEARIHPPTSRPARARQLCEVVTPRHVPLFVSPHDLASLRTDRRMSAAELGLSLLPLGMGNCCGRQNIATASSVLAASGASTASLSRGPWCPSSAFWILHRRTLPRQLAGLRLWQQAYDAQALTRERKRLRWEYVGCSMLAPNEAVLHLYYNYSRLSSI